MTSDMAGFYLGALLGAALLVLFLRHVTAYRLIMGLIFAAGLAVCSFLGLLLAWPVLSRFSLAQTGWVWAGPVLGAGGWCLAFRRGRVRDASPDISSGRRS